MLAKVQSPLDSIALLVAFPPGSAGRYSVAGAGQWLLYSHSPLCRNAAPKVVPLPRERWCSWLIPSRLSLRRPHDPHSIILCVCVCFSKQQLYCLTAAALRRKAPLSAASEGCHYCWALNIVIRGRPAARDGALVARLLIIFLHSSLAARHNV